MELCPLLTFKLALYKSSDLAYPVLSFTPLFSVVFIGILHHLVVEFAG